MSADDFKWVAERWDIIVTTSTLDELLAALTERVEKMLVEDRRRLFQAFYRLDVDEQRVERVFQTRALHEQPRALAELILEREMKKAQSRRTYES